MTIQEYRELPKRSLKAGELRVGMFLATAYKFTEISDIKIMPKTVKIGYKIDGGKTLYWNIGRDKYVQIKIQHEFDLVEFTKGFFENERAIK